MSNDTRTDTPTSAAPELPSDEKLLEIYGARFKHMTPQQVKRRFDRLRQSNRLAVTHSPSDGWRVGMK
jgi:hypothetical protein